LENTLKRHDVIAMAEKRRRNLVKTAQFEGCRCCYDQNNDGGEYRALIEYKQSHPIADYDAIEKGEYENLDAYTTSPSRESDGDDSDDEFDYLLDEDLPSEKNALEDLEYARRSELENQILANQVAMQHGYGTHRQLHPTRVLKVAGLGDNKNRYPPPAVVLHLVEADSVASASMDYFIETKLAPSNKGTIFLRSGGRSTLLMDSALAKKVFPWLNADCDMPCLVAIKDGIVINTCPRLSGLCMDTDGPVNNRAVEEWLDRCGLLLAQTPRMEKLCNIRPEEEALMNYLGQTKPEEELEIDYYSCGVAGCSKTFRHEHVGIKTSEQCGLVVKEDTILGFVESEE
jgi:hypothetical protein